MPAVEGPEQSVRVVVVDVFTEGAAMPTTRFSHMQRAFILRPSCFHVIEASSRHVTFPGSPRIRTDRGPPSRSVIS
jgi:hypothetical protein